MGNWENLSLEDIFEYVDSIGLIKEEWADIDGYEGYYKISNFGRVKSLKRTANHNYGGLKTVRERIRKQNICDTGYLKVFLKKKSTSNNSSVHVLVANAFISNPDNKPDVNHLKGIKTDNRYFMLEWATKKENAQHALNILGIRPSHLGNWCRGKRGSHSHNAKKIICLTNGKIYNSIYDAAKELNVNASNISSVCRKIRTHTGGYRFEFI